jgi:DNA-directed RNA polymerase
MCVRVCGHWRPQADVHWDQEARIKVGAALLALLVENSSLPSGLPGTKPKPWNAAKSAAAAGSGSSSSKSAPGAGDLAAFEYVYVKSGLKQQSFVRASQALVRVLLADRGLAAHLLTKVPPMLVPPLPWSGYNSGGYLTSRCAFGCLLVWRMLVLVFVVLSA